MNWQGIRRDTDDTSMDGIIYASNVRYYSEGEIGRRRGMERAASFSGTGIVGFKTAASLTQYAVIFTTTGTLEAVAL